MRTASPAARPGQNGSESATDMTDITYTTVADGKVRFKAQTTVARRWMQKSVVDLPAAEAADFKRRAEGRGLVVRIEAVT